MITENELKKLVGSSDVVNNKKILETYSTDLSFVNRIKPDYVVKVKSVDDIQKLVNIAPDFYHLVSPGFWREKIYAFFSCLVV